MTSSNENHLSIEEFLKLAAEFELESARYYEHMLTFDLDKPILQLAEMLEKQEKSHYRILSDFDITGARGFIQFPPDFSLTMPTLEHENPSMDELFFIAIEREFKSKEIYEHVAGFTSGTLKELVQSLVIFEQEHINRLQSLKDNY